MTPSSLRWLPALALALGLAAQVACTVETGGSLRGFSTETTAKQVEVSADPAGKLRWTQATYETTAGTTTFVVKNPSPTTHNFVLLGASVNAASANILPGHTQPLTLADLAPGEYQIYCTIPGHREGGMVAKLVVK